MKLKHLLSMLLAAACPLLMAPVSIDGPLGNFSQGTSGGQNAASWGLPQGDAGQSSRQDPAQQSSQSSHQSSSQSASSSSQNSTQDPKGEPNESTDATTQDPKGEPNESGDGSTQDPKGEPNYADTGSRGRSSGGRSSTSDGDYSPLDPSDGQYDPTNANDNNQIPSGCVEAGSECAQCVRDAEANIQFNRRYLHTAWSITHSTIEYANKKIAFGDSVSSIHGAMGLSWQLAGKPQIEEAVADLHKTYGKKYRDYTGHIERSLRKMADCEQNNFATRDLYQRFGFLYMEFIRSRYESPD